MEHIIITTIVAFVILAFIARLFADFMFKRKEFKNDLDKNHTEGIYKPQSIDFNVVGRKNDFDIMTKPKGVENKIELTQDQKEKLFLSICCLPDDKSVFGHDEDGKCSVNTSFISDHAPVYFDYDSYDEGIYAMIDYFELCMNSPKSILADSLVKTGFPNTDKFHNYIIKY